MRVTGNSKSTVITFDFDSEQEKRRFIAGLANQDGKVLEFKVCSSKSTPLGVDVERSPLEDWLEGERILLNAGAVVVLDGVTLYLTSSLTALVLSVKKEE